MRLCNLETIQWKGGRKEGGREERGREGGKREGGREERGREGGREGEEERRSKGRRDTKRENSAALGSPSKVFCMHAGNHLFQHPLHFIYKQ